MFSYLPILAHEILACVRTIFICEQNISILCNIWINYARQAAKSEEKNLKKNAVVEAGETYKTKGRDGEIKQG